MFNLVHKDKNQNTTMVPSSSKKGQKTVYFYGNYIKSRRKKIIKQTFMVPTSNLKGIANLKVEVSTIRKKFLLKLGDSC